MLVEATPESLTFEFYSIVNGGTLIDSYMLDQSMVASLAEELANRRVFIPQFDTYVFEEEPIQIRGFFFFNPDHWRFPQSKKFKNSLAGGQWQQRNYPSSEIHKFEYQPSRL